MKSCAVCPLATRTEPLPLPTSLASAQALAVTAWGPAGTLSVAENVPAASGARSADALAGVAVTETRVIRALDVTAVTTTRTNASLAGGDLPQAHTQSAMQAHRTGQGTGSTTTKKLSVRASRVSVAVKMHAPALTVGVQVAFA